MCKMIQITGEDLSFCPPGTIFTTKRGLESILISDNFQQKEVEFRFNSHTNLLWFKVGYETEVTIDFDVYKSAILGSIKKMFQISEALKPQLWNSDDGNACFTFLDELADLETSRIYVILNCNIKPFLAEGSTIDLF